MIVRPVARSPLRRVARSPLVQVAGAGGAAAQPLRFVSPYNKRAGDFDAAPLGALTCRSTMPLLIGSGAVSELMFGFVNWRTVGGGTGGVELNSNGYSIDRMALVLGDKSAYAPVTFSSGRSIPVGAGATLVLSDPFPASAFSLTQIARGAKLFMRWDQSVTTAGHFLPSSNTYGGIGGGYPDAVNVWLNPATNTSFTPIDSTDDFNFAGTWVNRNPMMFPVVLGRFVSGDPRTRVLVGDSITEGSADELIGYMMNGYAQRALFDADLASNPIGGMQLGQGSSTAAMFTGANADKLVAMLQYANTMSEGYGTNNFLTAPGDLAATQAQLQALWALFNASGNKIVSKALFPRVVQSGTYNSEAAQTYLNAAWDVGGNARLLSAWKATRVGTELAGFVPLNTTRGVDPWKWLTNGADYFMTGDGTHLSVAASILAAAEERTAMAAL